MKFAGAKYSTSVFFLLLFSALLLLFYPVFDNPPRSDFWSVFYAFHQVNPDTGKPDLATIANHDPWRHGTFRPLSHLILYFQYLAFGSNFIWSHVINFSAYCLCLLMLYLFAVELSVDRMLAGSFIGLSAFLFSHFDIVSWTFHVFTLLAYSAMLAGFILYGKFLKTGRRRFLLPIAPCFVFGMLSSEVYSLWPLGLLILGWGARYLFPARKTGKERPGRPEFLLLAAVYAVYFAIFALTRSAGHDTGPLKLPSPAQLVISLGAIFFNFIYTNIGVNLVPGLNLPAGLSDNLDMGGNLITWAEGLVPMVLWTGGIAISAATAAAVFLVKKKKTRAAWLLGFIFFLIASNFFVVASGRATTNLLVYVFAQFRYQFVPNTLTALLAAAALDTLLKPVRREKAIIAAALLPVLAANIFTVSIYIGLLNRNLEPLKVMIADIREHLYIGEINPERKLYIDERITGELSPLCWNRNMGRFMRGTYQWMFSSEEIRSFAFSRADSAWEILPGTGQKVLWRTQR